jgi:glyoxylase-like metal-dependent hydrolase (beta-lactamase superfamily II)
MAFVMRDGWKREPLSTTGADYVEPSAAATLKPGQRVCYSHFHADHIGGARRLFALLDAVPGWSPASIRPSTSPTWPKSRR